MILKRYFTGAGNAKNIYEKKDIRCGSRNDSDTRFINWKAGLPDDLSIGILYEKGRVPS